MKKVSIFSLTADAYAEQITTLLGKGGQHAKLLYKEWFEKGKVEGENQHFLNARALLAKMIELTDFTCLPLVKKGNEQKTEKYLLLTEEGYEIEMVLLPMRAGFTLCVSSQVGCKMGCAFCETGKMGLLRSLTTAEILAQVFQAKHQLGFDIRNIVFMGMGEPLDNYEAVMQAIRILTDSQAFGFGPSRITLSTSGLVDKIYCLIDDADPAICLAISVNAPHDLMRNRLMPVNQRFDMSALKAAIVAYTSHPRRRVFIEYVLIKEKTDSLQDAEALAYYLKGLKVTVNLIPYNPQSRGCFAPPDEDSIAAFHKKMKELGFLTFVRGTKGQKIMAACGQLGNIKLRAKKTTPLLNKESPESGEFSAVSGCAYK